MDTAQCVGVRVRAIRKRRSLTQEALAKLIGRTVESVSALERGRHKPSFETLQRLSQVLGVPVRDFFAPAGGDEAENPKQAALYSELLAAARTLPLADLEMTVEIVGVVAKRCGE